MKPLGGRTYVRYHDRMEQAPPDPPEETRRVDAVGSGLRGRCSHGLDAHDLDAHDLDAHGLDAHGETGLRAQMSSLVELMEADPNDLTAGERMDALRALVALSGQVDAALGRHAAGFDAHLDYAGDGARSTSAWLASRTEIPSEPAGVRVKRGKALRSCPIVEDAYRCGVIGTAKVDLALVARKGVEALFAEQEQVVVAIMADLTVRQAKRYLDQWRQTALATIGADDDKSPTDIAANSLHVSATFEGRRAINGDLDIIGGVELEGMLEAEITARFASGEYRADDGLLPSQRNAQALLALCRRGSTTATVAGEARPSITILIDLASLLGLPVHNAADLLNRRCQLADGTVVPLSKVLELSADATLNAVLGACGIQGTFHPVGEIRDARSANARQRRALAVRDQGCIFTGCDRPAAWSQAHHVDTWHATHQTTVPRLALLCSFHHHRIHDHGYTLETDREGTPTIRRPDGSLLPTPAPGRKIPPDPPPDAIVMPPEVAESSGKGPPETSASNPWSTTTVPGRSHGDCSVETCGWDRSGSDDPTEPRADGADVRPSGAPSTGVSAPARTPSRFRPLARKRSRTQIRTDLSLEQALTKLAAIVDRPRG